MNEKKITKDWQVREAEEAKAERDSKRKHIQKEIKGDEDDHAVAVHPKADK